MKDILNITNGDCAVDLMKLAGVAGDFLPWRDVLHEGPVPDGLSLEQLSELRAEYISNQGWGALGEIQQSFVERDNTLKSSSQYHKVILWFEHDLYDQLQILQILDWFNEHGSTRTELSIICTDQYLGMCSPSGISDLFRFEEAVSDSQLTLASTAWAAFRSASPKAWHKLLLRDTHVLPFLEGAVERLLQDYPACKNGLSRTSQTALDIVSKGDIHPGKVFAAYQETEERRFLGDSSFWAILGQLMASSPPLLVKKGGGHMRFPPRPEELLRLTTTGREVLAGEKNWLDITQADRWLGGVHLSAENCWCWNSTQAGIQIRYGRR